MKDVARRANVALGTVSKVVNGQSVREGYKERVEKAISELGYQVNTYARGLKISRSNAVALIVPDILHPFFASLAHYVEFFLYREGYKLTLCCADGTTEKEVHYLQLSQMNKVDGIIALTYGDVEEYISPDIPLVTFDRQFSAVFPPRVASDNYSGGVIAAEKFFELGCRAPAFVRTNSPFVGEVDKRRDGFLDACRKHGKEPVVVDLTDGSSSTTAVMKLINSGRTDSGKLSFDCVFCNTDLLAVTAKFILTDLGYSVPEDIQLIGFDGLRYFNSNDAPLYCSTIVQPVEKLAEKCVELVLAQDRSAIPTLTLLPVKFEYGGTTKQI